MSGLDPVGAAAAGVAAAARLAWKPFVLIVFAVWTITIGATHEPWVDEAQAWLIARDSTLWQILAERVRWEGTPPLWHLILWAAIRCGLPWSDLHLVSTAFAVVGAAVVVWRAPFPPLLRVLVVASYYWTWQYAVVARSYALELLLIPAAAALFADRLRHPLAYGAVIGLLANANAHGFVMAALLGFEVLVAAVRGRVFGRAAVLGGLAVAAAGGLLAVVTAWPPAGPGFLDVVVRSPAPTAIGAMLREAFVDRLAFWTTDLPTDATRAWALRLSLVLVAPSLVAFLRTRTWPLAFALLIGLVAFSAVGYASVWHAGLVFLAWVFCLWRAWPLLAPWPPLRRVVGACLAIVLAVQTAEGIATGLQDRRAPYTAAPAAAAALAAIRREAPSATIAAIGFKAWALQPLFAENPFADPGSPMRPPAFVVWDGRDNPNPSAFGHTEALFAGAPDVVLLSPTAFGEARLATVRDDLAAHGYRLAERFSGAMAWKGYERERDDLELYRRAAP